MLVTLGAALVLGALLAATASMVVNWVSHRPALASVGIVVGTAIGLAVVGVVAAVLLLRRVF